MNLQKAIKRNAPTIIQQYATCKDSEHCAILMAYLKSQKG